MDWTTALLIAVPVALILLAVWLMKRPRTRVSRGIGAAASEQNRLYGHPQDGAATPAGNATHGASDA